MKTIRQKCRTVGSSAYFGENDDWFIAAAVHRDSDVLTRSNWICFIERLKRVPVVESEQDTFTIERFSHWAVGWIDYLLVSPIWEAGIKEAESIRSALEDYPVLDDNHFSELEYEESCEYWKSCSIRDRVEICQKWGISCLKARHDWLPKTESGELPC